MIVLALFEPHLLNSEVSSKIWLYKGSHCHDSAPHRPQKELSPESCNSGAIEFVRLTFSSGVFSGSPTTERIIRLQVNTV